MKTLILALSLVSLNSYAQKVCQAVQKSHTQDGFTINYAEYKGDGSGNPIILIPPTGGENVLDRGYASSFCLNGMDTYILKDWTGFYEENYELELHQRHYERSVKAVNMMSDLIDSKNIGLLGTSLGGIFGSISTHLSPDITKAFTIAAGGNFHKVIGYSTHPAMRDKRRNRFRIFGFQNNEEYAAALDKEIKLDPFKLPLNRTDKKLGMVITLNDKVVPTSTQKELRDLWQPDEVYYMNSRVINIFVRDKHKAGIIQTYRTYKNQIINFFKQD